MIVSLFQVLEYDKFRDEKGELYLKDTREHTSAVFFTKNLQNQ
jgi:hypothetical protein